MFIFQRGGLDFSLTLNGLDRTALPPANVDVSYGPDQRLRGKTRFYGPLMGDLMRHEADLAIVHGVRHDTVSHFEGEMAVQAGRRHFTARSPAIPFELAQLLSGAARLSFVEIDPMIRPNVQQAIDDPYVVLDGYAARWALEGDRAAYVRPTWADAMSALQQEDAVEFLRTTPEEAKRYGETLRRADDVQRLLVGLDKSTVFRDRYQGPCFQVVLNGIRRNVAKGWEIYGVADWLDTHSDNDRLQRERVPTLLGDLAAFIDALKSERTQYGTLFEQTTIVMASELGRYPKFNAARGRDHWPETTWLLAGKGINPGVTVGATDEWYRGKPASYRSGATTGADVRPIFMDSMFATLAAALGLDPKHFGYAVEDVVSPVVTRV